MKNILQNSIVVILAIFVLFVSMGVNISRMSCDSSGQLYLGYETANCQENQVVDCCIEINKILCCNIGQEDCSSSSLKESCTQENTMIQYDFETTISSLKLIEIKSIILFTFNLINSNFLSQVIVLDYTYTSLYWLINKPILSELQSFLI